ncbi:MAG TPA: hypothetical protein PLL66_09535 [Bacteroidales bacterium]|nr:hypothetical protein [Bacteroidales bacterium]
MEKKIIFFTISLFLILSSDFVFGVVNSFEKICFDVNDRLEQTDSKAKIKSIERSKFYIFNSEINFDALAERSKIIYDNSGNITTMETYGSEDFLISRNEYIYDKDGNLKKLLSFNQDSVLRDKKINKYDNNGFITKQLIYNDKGKQIAKSYYKTDEKGRVIEVEQFDTKSKTPLNYITKKYDDAGNLVEMFQSIEKGGKGEKFVYYYDSENHEAGRDHFNEFGDIIESLQYQSVYDENGNWIQRTITNMNVLVFVEKRDIGYY